MYRPSDKVEKILLSGDCINNDDDANDDQDEDEDEDDDKFVDSCG